MQTRLERGGENGRAAIFHGPWLLAVDDEASPFFWDEPHQQNAVHLPATSDAKIVLERSPSVPSQSFAIPAARFSVEYLPGGYPMIPSRAVLRPVAEQTGTRSLNWQFWFRLE
jgi:hypothetical protein